MACIIIGGSTACRAGINHGSTASERNLKSIQKLGVGTQHKQDNALCAP